jgi:hypothetical protein
MWHWYCVPFWDYISYIIGAIALMPVVVLVLIIEYAYGKYSGNSVFGKLKLGIQSAGILGLVLAVICCTAGLVLGLVKFGHL